ncbi:MAG: hypothetical protein IKC56_03085 [Clostridia bacterium]|nr:hypothetical protein [Clostridia bacterium]
MEHYELKADEVILYRGSVTVSDKKTSAKAQVPAELLLTNHNVVLIVTEKHFLAKTTFSTQTYPVETIKFYDGSAQIIHKKTAVDIYFVGVELFLLFPNKKESRAFADKALRLVSGENKVVRGVKKVKKAINETNEGLDIDIQSAVVTTAKFAGQVALGVAGEESASKSANIVAKLLTRKKKAKTDSLPTPKKK